MSQISRPLYTVGALVASALTLLTLGAQTAHAQSVFFNEVLFNPPGADNGFEYIELASTLPSTSLTGLTLLIMEGENVPAGTVDQAISLNSFVTGSNGLLLLRDSATFTPAPGTSVVTADFAPDIENGANTFLIVDGFTGSVGTDYDANNDGILDSLPWTSVVSGFGYIDNASGSGGTDYVYALPNVEVVGPQTGSPNGGGVVTPDAYARINGTGYVFRINGANPGPYTVNPNFVSGAGATGYVLTPGSANVVATVPEPTTVALFGFGLLGGIALKIRRSRRSA
ncbi:MAG: PEP-CTERM sorting domain-containing protein [Fibrella sp.]|nr:PEP-CTERM sorting domain-containing protein [Armatimonadota bacterium]